jgi:predicted AlkP superfamily phosphohydrolase/phosphomutase
MNTIVLGLDAFDPQVFERLTDQGELPALASLAEQGGYARLGVSNPPQSEVSWTSISTGLSPAGHGIFDFVHRYPENYHLSVSLLPTQQKPFGVEFVPPHNSHTIFNQAIQKGYPATTLWWPATFPARLDSPVRSIPGLGTPDIHGRLGVGAAYALEAGPHGGDKIPVSELSAESKTRFTGVLPGPARKKSDQSKESTLAFQLDFLDESQARLEIGGQTVELTLGAWGPILELKFKLGLFVSVSAITRLILTQGLPSPQLYFLPLQLHPLRSPWRYATPGKFVKQTWRNAGGFLSLGWPQDTTALEEGFISDAQFLDLCDQIFATRKGIFLHHLADFNEGVLACVFDTLDRVQHMFWRDQPEVIEAWYRKLDQLVGQVVSQIDQRESKPHLLVVSDHGFANFDTKVHLNRWLEENGYLLTRPEADPAGKRSLAQVDWTKSKAYAAGLNSLYLNLAGREGRGCVQPNEKENLLQEIRQGLLSWRGPDGRGVFHAVKPSREVYQGPFSPYAPDLILGYAEGYRASADTGLGKWALSALESNSDHWGADHCIDADLVPGVIFSNLGLDGAAHISYRDFPQLAVGMTPQEGKAPPQPGLSSEGQAEIEERLKGLGYL